MSIFVGAIVYIEYLEETPETDLALIPVLFIVELILDTMVILGGGKLIEE